MWFFDSNACWLRLAAVAILAALPASAYKPEVRDEAEAAQALMKLTRWPERGAAVVLE